MSEELKKVADALVEKPVELVIDIKPTGKVHALLQKWKILPKKKVYLLRPLVVGSLVKISKLLLSLEFDIESMKNITTFYNTTYEAMRKHGRAMAEIIAIAIVNRRQDPPACLVRFVENNFTSKDLMNTLAHIVAQMDVSNFSSSIISVRTMHLLKMSPNDQGS